MVLSVCFLGVLISLYAVIAVAVISVSVPAASICAGLTIFVYSSVPPFRSISAFRIVYSAVAPPVRRISVSASHPKRFLLSWHSLSCSVV